MNNVKEILNKTYQRIGSTSGDTFFTQQLDGEFVICSNGARIKLTTLLSEFQLADGNGGSSSINESQSQIGTANINPDTFFNTAGPLAPITEKVREDSIPAGAKNPIPSIGGLNLQDEPTQPNEMTDEPQQQVSNRLPEWDMFDRIKKTEDVELSVTVSIKLPKARHIDAINDMYQTKFSAYLAKQYLSNPVDIQTQIREAIEEWMEIELNGGKRKKKVTGHKTIKPKKGKVKEKVTTLAQELKAQPQTNVNVEAGSAAALFGPQAAIDKDVTKLGVIVDDEQYQAAKNYFKNLPENHKDYDRFESMISLWEEQL